MSHTSSDSIHIHIDEYYSAMENWASFWQILSNVQSLAELIITTMNGMINARTHEGAGVRRVFDRVRARARVKKGVCTSAPERSAKYEFKILSVAIEAMKMLSIILIFFLGWLCLLL